MLLKPLKIRNFLIFFTDLISFFGSLILVLLLRYGKNDFSFAFFRHIYVFVILFVFWLGVSYIFELWNIKSSRQRTIFFKNLFWAVLAFVLISIIFLYLFSSILNTAPKINLLIFSVIFLFLNYLLGILIDIFIFRNIKTAVLFLDEEEPGEDILNKFKDSRFGNYKIIKRPEIFNFESIKEIVKKEKDNILIVFPKLDPKGSAIDFVYKLIPLEVELISIIDFYEMIMLKIPIDRLEEYWFISNIDSKKFYKLIKRLIDISCSLGLIVLFIPLFLVISLLVFSFEERPTIFKQKRSGKNNEPFILYKFKTMKDEEGPLWTIKGDKRITKLGRILRKTHLDELPQLVNILKGDMSFMGPRAERVELAELYSKNISFYEARSIIRPGFTGWAQIHFKPSASLNEGKEKLEYDFFYIKNCSLWLDFLILLKTAKLFFINPK